ncbi:MAG: hypothetical protein KDI82_03605 [Gammaproteobacteria bacterium]|nr:hypothetical protein [Gammaproteobacteria bacterium]
MRIIYLTLGFFILLGIGAACRTPPLTAGNCPPGLIDDPACVGKKPGGSPQ